MTEKIYLQIITYNHKGIEVGKKFRKIAVILFGIIFILAVLTDVFKLIDFNSNIVVNIGVFLATITLLFLIIGSLIIGYHQNKLEKKGQ